MTGFCSCKTGIPSIHGHDLGAAPKQVFYIDVSICPKCGGEFKAIASIEDQAVFDKILQHLQAKVALPPPTELLPATRAAPTSNWFA